MKKFFTFLLNTKIGIMSILLVLVAILCWSTHWNTRATESLKIINTIQIVAIVMGLYSFVYVMFIKNIPWIKKPIPKSTIIPKQNGKVRVNITICDADYNIITNAIEFLVKREHINFKEEANRITNNIFENITYEQFFKYCEGNNLLELPIYHLLALQVFKEELERLDKKQN